MNLRDFLEQRERELTHEIVQLRARLIPLESELAEVRQTRERIGALTPIPGQDIGDEIAALGRSLEPIIAKGTTDFLEDVSLASKRIDLGELGPNPYANLTIKQLVVRALEERFPHGATSRQLLDLFKNAWGRDIDRNSFSPQLSRLFQEGMIGRIRSNRGWFPIRPEFRIAGQRPYLYRDAVFWMDQAKATDQHEPLLTRDIDGVGDRMPFKRVEIISTPSGLIDRRATLVWLLPHEVRPDDAPALRHEFPTADDD